VKGPFARKKQCKACPWKKSTNPHEDIPNYDPSLHCELVSCGATSLFGTKLMACHESKPGKQYACVGWMVNQLGPGNNIGLRLAAMRGKIGKLEVVGEQHEDLVAMCAAAEQ